jgi:uncharacterized protein
MDQNDRQIIDDLFSRLAEAERNAPERDAEAETLIRERIGRQPDAPYYMLQTIAVQQQALEALQQRVADLEQRNAGGFLGRLFGAPPATSRPVGARMPGHPAQHGGSHGPHVSPWGRPRQGGGFMAGAMQTAAGVAGGVLIGNALAGMLAGDEAAAEKPAPEDEMDFGDEEI